MARARRLTLAILVLWTAAAATLAARQPTDTTAFRVFLQNGSALTSYGEWARAGDRVVFSMPLVPAAGPSEIHLVSVPAARVDWPRTERYAHRVRAETYARTRGEADFARLSAEVAQALNTVALQEDPASRLKTAEAARRELADWPRAHYGYRAEEVGEIVGLLDGVVAELREGAGLSRFNLELTADTPVMPAEPLLPAPTRAELVEQLMTASTLAETPAAKVSLLHSVVGLLDRAIDVLPETWAANIRRMALGGIAAEARTDREYADLRESVIEDATKYARRADVRALQRLRTDVHEKDERLGSRRHGEVSALLATIDSKLDAARRLRLARDQWRLRQGPYQAYADWLEPTMDLLAAARDALGEVKAMAGPDPVSLTDLNERLAREKYRLGAIVPPEGLESVHAVFRSAWSLAASATRLRLEAVRSGSLDEARQASASAAGALMLLARAHEDLGAAMRPPELQ